MSSALEDVVRLGGLALQKEDCLIRAAMQCRGKHGGLALNENERYHQFIIWRAVLPLWDAVTERDQDTDLILKRDGEQYHFELKNWRGKSGNEQLPDIRRDFGKMQSKKNGYILITSGNPHEETNKNFDCLEKEVAGLSAAGRQVYRFATENPEGTATEYWVAGWPVLKP